MSTTRRYIEAVFARPRVPMEPTPHVVDWDDQPSRFTPRPDAARLPLPPTASPVPATVAEVVAGNAGRAAFGLESLAALLRLSYGVLSRRLRVDWNNDHFNRSWYGGAVWGRGTASGGGLYPLEIYWITGPRGPLLPGVYHYEPGHHALERLFTGDVTARVRAATRGAASASTTDQYLVVAVRFWKNTFKYSSFGYHVVTQDAGALLGTWELLARGLGAGLDHVLWFDDAQINLLIGADSRIESALAVVPLSWTGSPSAGTPETDTEDGAPLVTRRAHERSRRKMDFPMVDEVHRAALVTGETRPDPVATRHAAPGESQGTGAETALGNPDARLKARLDTALRVRRSSFGHFTAATPLDLDELAAALIAGAGIRRYRADHKDADGAPPLTTLMVSANRVDGLRPGHYAYEATGHRLRLVGDGPVDEFLQRSYQLQNYNLERAGAVISIAGRPEAMLQTFGPRGYRMLNAEVGMVAQAIYVAASAMEIGVGAVLGLDNLSMNTALGLDGTDLRTLLFVLLGHQVDTTADFDYPLT